MPAFLELGAAMRAVKVIGKMIHNTHTFLYLIFLSFSLRKVTYEEQNYDYYLILKIRIRRNEKISHQAPFVSRATMIV